MSQQSKAPLQFAINTQIADNTSGDISAADIRDNLINLTDSLLFNSGSQTLTGSLTLTDGITGSLNITGSLTQQSGSINLGVPDMFGSRNLSIFFNGVHESAVLAAGVNGTKTNRISFDSITGATNISATSSINLTAPTTNIFSPITNITSSLGITGSISLNGLITLQPINPLPTVTNGSIAFSSSGDFYFGSGSAWRKLTL